MKKGRNKVFAIAGIFMAVVLVASVMISAAGDKIGQEISEKVQDYITEVAGEKGIDPAKINNITEVNFDELPKEVAIDNIDEANIAIYQIDYNKTPEKQENVFMITYSVDRLETQGDLIVSQDKREFLNFGFNGERNESGFLKTATGVESSLEKGYVMMRDGSVIGISTNLEVAGEGNLEVTIYKNGKQVNFGNSFVVDSDGVKKDYDTQSKGTVSFEAGDVISMQIQSSDGVSWKDATTLVEILTD